MERGLWVWICLLILLVVAGWSARYYDVAPTFICAMELVHEEREPADVLLVGSSRIGTAVDLVYLQKLLRRATGDQHLTVEKLVSLQSNPAQYHVMLRDYVASRGAPRLVLIAVPHALRAETMFHGAPLYLERTLLFSSMSSIVAVHTGFLRGDTAPFLRRISEKDWQSIGEIVLFRATESVYAILRSVPRRVDGDELTCPPDRRMSLAGRQTWPHGVLDDDVDPTTLGRNIVMTRGQALMARKFVREMVEVDLQDPRRILEMQQVRQMSNYLLARGSRVVLTEIPVYTRKDLPGGRAEAYAREVPGTEFLDSYEAFEGLPETVLPSLFRDAAHMNLHGAQLETAFLGSELPRYLR